MRVHHGTTAAYRWSDTQIQNIQYVKKGLRDLVGNLSLGVYKIVS